MKVYTILTTKDPEALTKFVQTVKDVGATGVTIFTRPSTVATEPPAGMQTEQELSVLADAAAAKKDYKAAADYQKQIDTLKGRLAELSKVGCQWIADIIEPVKQITQLVVLGNLHWPAEEPFSQSGFMAKMEKISNSLLTTGIAGIKQQTPLYQRTFIPLPGAAYGAQGDPATGSSTSPFETAPSAEPPASKVRQPASKLHPSIPVHLSEKQAQFATFRLGLDRGGQRRSRNEAGNLMGHSPNIAAKMENSIKSVWREFSGIISSSDVLA